MLVGGVVYLLEWVAVIGASAAGLNLMIGGGLGVAIVAATYVMVRSGLFPTGLDVLYVFPLVFWVWMLWSGVLLWRRTPSPPA